MVALRRIKAAKSLAGTVSRGGRRSRAGEKEEQEEWGLPGSGRKEEERGPPVSCWVGEVLSGKEMLRGGRSLGWIGLVGWAFALFFFCLNIFPFLFLFFLF